MLSIYQWHYFSTNMNIALSTSKIVICYSPQTQQSAFRSFASQKRTTTHSTVYIYNYKRSSLPRITTPRQLERAFPFTNYNTSFLVNPDNKTINPIPTVRPFRTLDICPFATVCFRGPTKYSQAPFSSTSAISRTFSVRFLPFLNSICTRGRKQQSK